jgi:homogentisate 1,2-dioxygenase
VIFPERWMVMEHTMRLPYYHRNTMSEFMGLIRGKYDAKSTQFQPGGASLHNCMAPHGPDAASYAAAISTELTPHYYKDTLAFMLESYYPWEVSPFALSCPEKDENYLQCWQEIKRAFR